MSGVHLVTKRGCPFAERTRIVLAAKGLRATITEIDMAQKPSWFLARSPLGKVPMLVHRGCDLVESTVVNEYLDEVFADPPLMPLEPQLRAQARYWILFDETRLVPAFYRLVMAQTPTKRAAAHERLASELSRLIQDGLASSGGFLVGGRLTLADITLFTHLRRLPLVAEQRGPLSLLSEPKLRSWIERVASMPCVAQVEASDEGMRADLAPYFEGLAEGATAKDLAGA